jgi:hypothetical protein
MDLVTRQKTSPLSRYLTSGASGVPVARLLIQASGVPGASDMVIDFTSRYLAVQLLRAYTRQLAVLIDREARTVKDSGQLATFLDQFKIRRAEIELEFGEVQTELNRGLENLYLFINLINANAGSGSSMFGRHSSFAGKLLRNASPMGR